jgi:hypothetical protein
MVGNVIERWGSEIWVIHKKEIYISTILHREYSVHKPHALYEASVAYGTPAKVS